MPKFKMSPVKENKILNVHNQLCKEELWVHVEEIPLDKKVS